MEKRDFVKTRVVYVCGILFIFCILHPINLFGQEAPSQKSNKVEVRGNLVSIDVEDADVADVLKEIEKRSGVKITIGQGLLGKKVSVRIEDKDVEGALREILRDQYYVLYFTHDPENKEKKVLKEVTAKGDVIGSKPMKGKLITVDIPYGSGNEEVGASKESEGGSRGPLSFAVDNKGNVYICDTVNRRIQVFSPSGAYLSTIPLQKDIFATDIAVDDHGFIYVYDRSVRKIYQYDKSGEVVTSIDVDGFWGAAGPLRFINNVIYMDYCDANLCGYFIVGRVLSNNSLVGRSEEEKKIPYQEQQQGTIELSGKKSKGRKFVEGYNSQTDIIDKGGLSSKTLSLPSKGIWTRIGLGEDLVGNFYFATGSDEYNYKLYDVDKFDAEGNYVSTAKIPSGHHEFWAVKEFELSKNGNIYNFVPGDERLTIHIFLNEDR